MPHLRVDRPRPRLVPQLSQNSINPRRGGHSEAGGWQTKAAAVALGILQLAGGAAARAMSGTAQGLSPGLALNRWLGAVNEGFADVEANPWPAGRQYNTSGYGSVNLGQPTL